MGKDSYSNFFALLILVRCFFIADTPGIRELVQVFKVVIKFSNSNLASAKCEYCDGLTEHTLT